MKTALTHWTPGRNLVRDRFSRVFEDAFNDMLRPLAQGEDVSDRRWLPAVDIRETDEALSLTVDLPGIDKDDVHLTLENNVLTIAGERKFENEETNDNCHRIERSYGAFSRSFTLPRNVKSTKVKAAFDRGVLGIEIPKEEEAKPRRITIG